MKRSKIRLIDEETLKKSIEKWLNPDPNADRMVDIDDIAVSVMMEIEEQPTAYDVDKVVEQLDTYITKLVGRNSALYQTVMQIVKGGGVDGYVKGNYISLSYGKYKGVCR